MQKLTRSLCRRVPFELSVTNSLIRRDFGEYRRGDRLEFFAARADPGGPPTHLGVGVGAYLVNHHDDVAHLLQFGAEKFEKTRRLTNRRGRRLSGNGILTSTGNDHRVRRELLAPSFRRRAVTRDAESTANRAAQWAQSLQDGSQVNITDAMFDIAEQAILESILANLDDAEYSELRQAVRARRHFLNYVYTSPIPYKEFAPNTIVSEHRRLIQRFEEIVRTELVRRREAGEKHGDLLGDLLSVSNENDEFGDDDIIDEIRMVALTGHETVAEALMWTLWLLAKHPDEQERVADEARALGRTPLIEDIATLERANAAVSESLRLFPPTWLYVRRAIEPDTLPSGLSVKRGAKFYICPYVLHRDPAVFPHPEEFQPDRFLGDARFPRGAYVPFGLGRHTCLGEPYARLAIDLAVSAITRHVELRPASDVPLHIQAGITLRADPQPRAVVTPRLEVADAN